jgi:hypothetical protein
MHLSKTDPSGLFPPLGLPHQILLLLHLQLWLLRCFNFAGLCSQLYRMYGFLASIQSICKHGSRTWRSCNTEVSSRQHTLANHAYGTRVQQCRDAIRLGHLSSPPYSTHYVKALWWCLGGLTSTWSDLLLDHCADHLLYVLFPFYYEMCSECLTVNNVCFAAYLQRFSAWISV